MCATEEQTLYNLQARFKMVTAAPLDHFLHILNEAARIWQNFSCHVMEREVSKSMTGGDWRVFMWSRATQILPANSV